MSGSLKARVTGSSPTPAPQTQTSPSSASTAARALHVKFAVNDATVSGASVQLVGEAYRLSLLKRNIRTGKYFADPISR